MAKRSAAMLQGFERHAGAFGLSMPPTIVGMPPISWGVAEH